MTAPVRRKGERGRDCPELECRSTLGSIHPIIWRENNIEWVDKAALWLVSHNL